MILTGKYENKVIIFVVDPLWFRLLQIPALTVFFNSIFLKKRFSILFNKIYDLAYLYVNNLHSGVLYSKFTIALFFEVLF